MGGLSLGHYLIIAVVLLVFFGPSRLPQLGQSLGKAIKGFKDGLNEIDTEAKDVTSTQLNAAKENLKETAGQTSVQKESDKKNS